MDCLQSLAAPVVCGTSDLSASTTGLGQADSSLVLYIAYFPRKPALARENTTEEVYAAKVEDLRVERRKGYAVAWVCLAHL